MHLTVRIQIASVCLCQLIHDQPGKLWKYLLNTLDIDKIVQALQFGVLMLNCQIPLTPEIRNSKITTYPYSQPVWRCLNWAQLLCLCILCSQASPAALLLSAHSSFKIQVNISWKFDVVSLCYFRIFCLDTVLSSLIGESLQPWERRRKSKGCGIEDGLGWAHNIFCRVFPGCGKTQAGKHFSV